MEKDLFNPIKEYFEKYGYLCDGEVNDIDLYMEKDGVSVAVELKVSFDFKVLQQAALRQAVTDFVFIGIFRPRDLYSASFKDKLYLCKRLGIGVIVVSKSTKAVEVINEPSVSELSSFQRANKGKKAALSEEFQRRRVKNNTGGVNKTRLITGYREDALLVLDALSELGGESSTKEIRELSGIKHATKILYDNYYGWFASAGRGRYMVRDEGYNALEEFEETLYALKRGKIK